MLRTLALAAAAGIAAAQPPWLPWTVEQKNLVSGLSEFPCAALLLEIHACILRAACTMMCALFSGVMPATAGSGPERRAAFK